MQLDDMQQEKVDVIDSARRAASARSKITDVISSMDNLALTCLEKGDDARAREILKVRCARTHASHAVPPLTSTSTPSAGEGGAAGQG